MGADSNIEWTDHTFNPWRGCEHAVLPDGTPHAGCLNCYAETMSKRNPAALGEWGAEGRRIVASEAMWKQPLKWNEQAAADGVRARVFCASLGDVFEGWGGQLSHHVPGVSMWRMNEANGHPYQWGGGVVLDDPKSGVPLTLSDVRRRLFELIDATPNLDWLLLTKRPENILRYWTTVRGENAKLNWSAQERCESMPSHPKIWRRNCWLGTSVSLQEHADHQIRDLVKNCDLAPRLFLSIEPLLGPIVLPLDLRREHVLGEKYKMVERLRAIDWVIVGGESGGQARPMHPDWARSLRDQCTAAGVPFFFKQWGEWAPVFSRIEPDGPLFQEPLGRVGKKKAGRLLDGVEHSQFPEAIA